MYKLTYFINDYLYSIGAATGLSAGLVGVIAGLLLILAGFRIKKIALTLIGFFVGASAGAFLANRFFEAGTTVYFVVPIACGVIAAVLAFILYYAAIYIMGLAVGGSLGAYIAINYVSHTVWGIVIAVVLALIVGSLTLAIEKPIVIIGTGFIGYVAFRLGLYLLTKTDQAPAIEIACVVVGVGGIVFQFITTRKAPMNSRRKKRKLKEEIDEE